MCMWLWNGTKYVVEWTLTDKETLVYGIVFMPTMVINLGSSFVFKPMLTTLARHYEDKNLKIRRSYGHTCRDSLWAYDSDICGGGMAWDTCAFVAV